MSKKVAVISDTHGILRPELIENLKGCDIICHAGDIDEPEVLERLQAIAPVYVVRGNNDWEWAWDIPKDLRFTIEDCHFFMVHNRLHVPKDLKGIDMVIFGHTHQYFEKKIDGRWWLNPGSAGFPSFGRGMTMAELKIDGRDISIKRVPIPDTYA